MRSIYVVYVFSGPVVVIQNIWARSQYLGFQATLKEIDGETKVE